MKYEIKTTNIFDKWLGGLRDKTDVNRIIARIYRMEQGNMGDVKTVSQNLFEMGAVTSISLRQFLAFWDQMKSKTGK